MKRNYLQTNRVKYIWLAILFAFVGCSSMYTGDEFLVQEQEEPETPAIENGLVIGKKGICFTIKGDSWSERVSKVKAHWHYSWGRELSYKEPNNIDFVPMIWGRRVNDYELEDLKKLKDQGKIRYLLGFNEPDNAPQANMTVDEAIALWPKLEEVGVPLVSPAPAHWSGEWLDQFMAKAEENNLRVDYVGIHLYYGINAQKYLDICQSVWEKYNKPIWITEMAVADWDATPENHKYFKEQVLELMKELLPKLEELPYVFRYSWFSGQLDDKHLKTSALFDTENNLTSLGQFYANFKPNTIIGAGRDDAEDPNKIEIDPNDKVLNGHFEDGQFAPWLGNGVEHLKRGDITPFNGQYCGLLKENSEASLYQVVELEPGETYEVTFQAQLDGTANKPIRLIVKEDTGGKKKLTKHNLPSEISNWTKTSVTFTAGTESKVRLIWFKPKGLPAFYLDAVTCIKKQ